MNRILRILKESHWTEITAYSLTAIASATMFLLTVAKIVL